MHLRQLRPPCANLSSSHHSVLSYPLVKLRCGRPATRNRRTNYSPSLSFTAISISCSEPRYLSVVSTDLCPKRNWICSSSPPAAWHSRAQVRRRSCGANLSIPARLARCRTIHQTNFSLTFDPQTLPAQLTRRKIVPSSIPDAPSHSSRTVFTHAGTGTVLILPPFPKRLTIAQCSSRCWKSVNLSPVSSALRKPHPRRRERMALFCPS